MKQPFTCKTLLDYALTITLLITASSTATVQAATYYWVCTAGNASNSACWNPNGKPTTNDTANIQGGNAVVTISNSNNLSANRLNASGTIQQTGGTFTGTYATLGAWYDKGTYNISGGNIQLSSMNIGSYYAGEFNHSSGTNNTNYLQVGTESYSTGSYNQSGGSLTTVQTSVGNQGNGTFNQLAGTTTNTNLYIGRYNSSQGTFNLSDNGILNTNGTEYIGAEGIGVFNQTGGTNTTNRMYIGQSAGSKGTYNLSGGTLKASEIDAVNSGVAEFYFTGGTLETDKYIGKLTNNGGTLKAYKKNEIIITDDYTQNNGTLLLDLQLDTGSLLYDYDYLTVNGKANLGGILDIRVQDNFVPIGDGFLTLISANSIIGTFDTVKLPEIVGWDFSLDYSGNYVKLVMSQISAVPLPAAFWLFGSTLLAFLGVTSRTIIRLPMKQLGV